MGRLQVGGQRGTLAALLLLLRSQLLGRRLKVLGYLRGWLNLGLRLNLRWIMLRIGADRVAHRVTSTRGDGRRIAWHTLDRRMHVCMRGLCLSVRVDPHAFLLGHNNRRLLLLLLLLLLLGRVRHDDPAVRHSVRYAYLVRIGHLRRADRRRLVHRRVVQIVHAGPSAPFERLGALDLHHLEPLVPAVRVHLAQCIRVLLGVAREQVDDVVVGDGRDVQGVDVAVVHRVADAVPLGWDNRQAVLGAGRDHRGGAERGVACVEEYVLLGEGVLGVAGRLDVGDARVLHRVVLRVRLVEVVVRVLAGVIAHAGANGDAGYLERGRLLPALVATGCSHHVARTDQTNRLVQSLRFAQPDRLGGGTVHWVRYLSTTVGQLVRFSVHIICHYYRNLASGRHDLSVRRSLAW